MFLLLSSIPIIYFLIRSTSFRFLLTKTWRSISDHLHVYNFYKVPENSQLYHKVSTYLSSLSSIEDSDYANLFSANKSSSNEISVQLDANQTVVDSFLGARVYWKNEHVNATTTTTTSRTFVLKIKKSDKRRILRPYLQHIHSISDEIEARRKEIKLYTNTGTEHRSFWRSVPFTHPASLDTIAMDAEVKSKVKSDLESFLKSKQYYNRLGRVWKRSYLLYGPSGTGKSSFIAAMAKFLCYDIYDLDISRISDNSELKLILLQTSSRSIIVVEDLDKILDLESTARKAYAMSAGAGGAGGAAGKVNLSGVLNFMDGIFSSCGEERIMVFTMNSKENVDHSILRPGRIDAQIYFPLCDFTAFKTLANNYLGLKDHKLFSQVEEIFLTGATLSPAEIGELMIVNRSSPSRALKSVITALQTDGKAGRISRRPSEGELSKDRSGDESADTSGVLWRESVHTVREFRKLYGLLRMKSSGRKLSGVDLTLAEKES